MSARGSGKLLVSLAALSVYLALPSQGCGQRGAVQHVHDPCVIKEKDTYYLFSTGFGIPVRKSTDPNEWQTAGPVFKEMPAWTFQAVPGFKGHTWAPDVSFFNGAYHLYYSVSTFGSRRSCIGLTTNKTLDPLSKDYRWVDRGKVVESDAKDNWNAIDPNIVLDEEGMPWLSFGSFWGGLKLVKIDPRTGMAADRTLHSIAARPGKGAIEAPFIVRKHGYYYLFASWDYCCKGAASDYKLVVGRAEKVSGPYLDRTGKPMTEGGGTLLLAGYDHVRGPGHNAVLSDGKHDWLVHHYYDARKRGVPTLQIRPLRWDKENWPQAGKETIGEPRP
jgi:arabinan endo-1,5-alpha-L-arabinosidase